jgi:hypothetical protein
MARDITTSNSGAVISAPAISPELRKILDAETVASYGGDEGTDGGADFHEGTWRQPKWLPENLRAEAENATPSREYWASPAPETSIRNFLNLLWAATRHNNDQNWDLISRVYPMLLRAWPAWCFRDDLLLRATDHFTWFPAVAELSEWLKPERRFIENDAFRLRFLSKLPNQPKAKRDAPPPEERGPWKPNSPEERAKVAAICADIRSRPTTPFRASLRPEDDRKNDFRPIGEAAVSDAKAIRDPDWAAYLETSRRMDMARDAADKAGDSNGWARFMVPLDQPLHGDLRAFYGHRCPGHEQPAVSSDEGAKSDMAPKSKASSFGEGENGPFSPASDAQEGAA